MIFVDGEPVDLEVKPLEDFLGFQSDLLSSSFAVWANQGPSHSSAIAANFVAQNFNQVRAIVAQLAALYPPTTEQLSEWQAIADAHQITSLRFLP